MRYLSKFIYMFGAGITLLVTSSTFAADADLTRETDMLIKEDIANAQVLIEMCPTLIGKNIKFDQNIQKMMDMYFNHYSDKSASLQSLQNDDEFKSLLQEVHQAATEISQTEQKSICEDVLNFKE